MSGVEVFKRITIRDRDGKIKFDSGLVPSSSFVIGFLRHMYGSFRSASVNIMDTGNVSRAVDSPSILTRDRHRTNAGDDNVNYGVVVGTGTTTETNTDYALATQIAHGTGAGQLDYGAHSFTAPSVVGSNVDMIVSRDFYNGSGASITVNEIGIYCKSRVSTTDKYFCIIRDVLNTPGVVDNAETLTVQYTLRTTV